MRVFLTVCVLFLATQVPSAAADFEQDSQRYVNVNGEIAAAIEACQNIIDSNQLDGAKLGAIYYLLGAHRYRNNQLEDAIAGFSKALELGAELGQIYRNRGLAHERLGRLDTALEDLAQALILDPKDGIAYFRRGMVLARIGKIDAAFEA